jgi:hypothetical protein
MTIIQKPTVPTWFLNREKDIVDGKNSQILSNSKLCDDLEHLKRSAHIVVSATTGVSVSVASTQRQPVSLCFLFVLSVSHLPGRRGKTVGVSKKHG